MLINSSSLWGLSPFYKLQVQTLGAAKKILAEENIIRTCKKGKQRELWLCSVSDPVTTLLPTPGHHHHHLLYHQECPLGEGHEKGTWNPQDFLGIASTVTVLD